MQHSSPPQYPQLYNRNVCPVLAISFWLLLARPYIQQAYADEIKRLREKADASLANGSRTSKAKDDEISALALRNLYLFPHVTSTGQLIFTQPMTHATATKHLAELRETAGMSDRAFTWHGVVSVDVPLL